MNNDALRQRENRLEEEEKLQKEREAIKRNRKADIFFLVPAAALTLLAIITLIFVGVGAIKLAAAGVWTLALVGTILKGRKSEFAPSLILNTFLNISLALVNLLAWSITSGFTSNAPWRYKAQVLYVDFQNNGSFDCFPDKLPDDVSDYKIEYVPSYLQGTGHFRVHFKTSAEQIANYEKKYSAQAIYTIPLSDFAERGGLSNGRYEVKEISSKATSSFGDKSLDVAYDYHFWSGYYKGATVYVVSAVHNWNHPHSGAVVINPEENMIEFTHLG